MLLVSFEFVGHAQGSIQLAHQSASQEEFDALRHSSAVHFVVITAVRSSVQQLTRACDNFAMFSMLQCNRTVIVRQSCRQLVMLAVSSRSSPHRYRVRGVKRRVQPSKRALSSVKSSCTATNRDNKADNASPGVQPCTSPAVVQLLCLPVTCHTDQFAAANNVLILFPWLSHIGHCHARLACPAVSLLASMKLSRIAPSVCLNLVGFCRRARSLDSSAASY